MINWQKVRVEYENQKRKPYYNEDGYRQRFDDITGYGVEVSQPHQSSVDRPDPSYWMDNELEII